MNQTEAISITAPRRWKLWHLSAIVGASALILGMARDPALSMIVLVWTAAASIPLVLVYLSNAMDRFLIRVFRGKRTTSSRVESFFVKTFEFLLALAMSGFGFIALLLWILSLGMG